MTMLIPTYEKVYYFTSTSTFVRPFDWNDNANIIICLGNGGNGAWYRNTGASLYFAMSGAGGAYAASTNIVLSPYLTYNVTIPLVTYTASGTADNTSTYGDVTFGGTSLSNCVVGAQSGQSGDPTNLYVAARGGLAASSVGQICYSGADGIFAGGSSGGTGGGGGAAGPSGNGALGGYGGGGPTIPGPSVGGTADNGTVAGGTASSNGLNGTEFSAAFGCGSGGGASNVNGTPYAGNGGVYGGGGAAYGHYYGKAAGVYGPGLVIVAYSPITPAALMIGL